MASRGMRWAMWVGLWAVGCLGAGCATLPKVSEPSHERVTATLEVVLAAEAEDMPIDSRAHTLRREARRAYQQAADEVARGRYFEGGVLLQRAEADAELALALTRQELWTAQAADAVWRWESLRARRAEGAGL